MRNLNEEWQGDSFPIERSKGISRCILQVIRVNKVGFPVGQLDNDDRKPPISWTYL